VRANITCDKSFRYLGCSPPPCFIVDKNTEQSMHGMPLPAGVLPHLSKTIKGPMFQGDARSASKRLNSFLSDIGIIDPRK
jgi:hypothetical protein